MIGGDLGEGSFAIVYRGYHEVSFSMHPITQPPNQSISQTHLQVAIKTVDQNGLSPKLFDNLQGDIDILKSLSQRHIARLLEVTVSPGVLHM